MFRRCQKFNHEGNATIFVPQVQTSDEGVMSSVEIPARDVKPLPDVHLFDLDKLLDAGVDLKQVSVKVQSRQFDVDKFTESVNKKNSKKQTTKGVENNE